MSPRGVAIPDLREQLFQAADRVLARDGPAALTGRAITREAGCATGLLYNHFADLPTFLAEYAHDRFRRLAEQVAELDAHAGQHTVADNLAAAAIPLLNADIIALGDLSRSRPAMARQARAARARRTPRHALQKGIAAYLDAEKKLARVRSDADSEALAIALIATVRHLLSGHRIGDSDREDQLRRIVEVLVRGVLP